MDPPKMGTSPINRWTLTYKQWRHLPNEGRDMKHTTGPAYWHPFCSEIMNPHIPAANTGAQLGQGLSNFRTGHKTLVFSNVTIPVQPSYLPNDPIFRASGDDSGHWWRMSQYDCSPRLEHYPNDKQWQVLRQDLVHQQFTSQRCCLC